MSFPAASCRLVCLTLALLGLVGSTPAQQDEGVPVEEETRVETVAEIGVCPEPDLNCHVVTFVRENVAGIIPSEDVYPQGTARQRHLAKAYFRQGVLESGGMINAWFQSNTLVAVEFDWFLQDGEEPPVHLTLGTRAAFHTSTGEVICYMYCYDLTGFSTRQQMLEQMIGHPMYTQRVWTGANIRGVGSLQTSGVVGDATLIRGAFGAEYVKIVGTANHLADGVEWVRGYFEAPGNTVGSTTQVASIDALTLPVTATTARNAALLNATYHPGHVVFDANATLPGGLVYAEGDITIKCSNQSSAVTFIAGGDVKLEGSNNKLICAHRHLAMVSLAGTVSINGSGNIIEGEVHGDDEVAVQGDLTTLHGVVQAGRVTLDGKGGHYTDGTHGAAPPSGGGPSFVATSPGLSSSTSHLTSATPPTQVTGVPLSGTTTVVLIPPTP